MEGSSLIHQQQAQSVQVSAAEISAKMQSKREVRTSSNLRLLFEHESSSYLTFLQIYRFLTSECRAYLPSADTVTVFHLRDVASGKRRMIKCEEVKVFQVPYYNGLKIETMLEMAENYPEVMAALPELERERNKLPRAYIANVLYTLVGTPFKDWVEEGIEQRNRKLADEQNLMVSLDP